MKRWLNRGAATVVVLVLVAAQVLSVPLYSGGSITANLSWRLEHGRVLIARSPVSHTENFYIDINSEGLRWRPQASFRGLGDWMVNVPLWMVLAPAGWWAFFAWRGRRRKGVCACGYELAGLAEGAVCPECGRKE